jgi:hypothetical protein
MAPVIDLMQALQKSLGDLPKRKPAAMAEAGGESQSTRETKKAAPKRQTARAVNG